MVLGKRRTQSIVAQIIIHLFVRAAGTTDRAAEMWKNTDKENNSTDKNNSDSINNDNSSATGSDNKLNFNVQIKK